MQNWKIKGFRELKINQRTVPLIENRRKDEIRNYIGHTWK